jgi:hypothetical protein
LLIGNVSGGHSVFRNFASQVVFLIVTMRKPFMIVVATAVLGAVCWTSGEPQRSAGTNNVSKPASTSPPRQPGQPGVPSKKITLVGITILSGKKTALLKTEAANKSAKPEIQNLALSEHQRFGEVEVLQIDEKRGSVLLSISGVEQLLTFERDLPGEKNTGQY